MFLTRCPVCRARFNGDEAIDDPCRRCSSELAAVRTLGRLAQYHQTTARYLMVHGDFNRAYEHALKAAKIIDDGNTRSTLTAVVILLALAGSGLPT